MALRCGSDRYVCSPPEAEMGATPAGPLSRVNSPQRRLLGNGALDPEQAIARAATKKKFKDIAWFAQALMLRMSPDRFRLCVRERLPAHGFHCLEPT